MSVPAISRIPESMMALVETLDEGHGTGAGFRIAIKLMQSFGGRDVKFPLRPAAGHPVVAALGMDDAVILCEVLAGGQIYIPHGRPAKSQRNAVLAMQARGWDRARIAAALGLSERHVRHLANTERIPDPLPLFPDD